MSKVKKPYLWVEQPTVISALRRTFRRYPPYQEVRARCKREWWQECKNGNKRRRVNFECECCHVQVSAKEFVVDHIDPVVSISEGFVDYNTYSKRLFCAIVNLQGICKSCHKDKSKAENAQRRKNRKASNEHETSQDTSRASENRRKRAA